jgi:hypothetical protein
MYIDSIIKNLKQKLNCLSYRVTTLENSSSTLVSSEWIDYSNTSVITGFSSYTTKNIKYKIIDSNSIHIIAQIEGPSNGTQNATFTLPFNTSTTSPTLFPIIHLVSNGQNFVGRGIVTPNTNLVTCSIYTNPGFVSPSQNGTKGIRASFLYMIN